MKDSDIKKLILKSIRKTSDDASGLDKWRLAYKLAMLAYDDHNLAAQSASDLARICNWQIDFRG